MKLVIPGDPMAKARHRSCLRGKHIVNYDIQQKEKERVKWFLREWLRDQWDTSEKAVAMEMSGICYASSLYLNFTFYMPYPKSLSKLEEGLIEWGKKLHSEKPDVDNLVKFYLDCMNGVLFEDDRLVSKLSCRKEYSRDPRVEVEIVKMRKKGEANVVDSILAQFSKEELKQLVSLVESLRRLLRPLEWTLENDLEEEESLRKLHFKLSVILSEIAEKYSMKFSKVKKIAPSYYKEVEYAAEEGKEQEDNLREYCDRDA